VKNFHLWLIGFGCGLIVPVLLNVIFWDGGVQIGATFGVLILIVAAARHFFQRKSSSSD